tara:strand:- start:777 stop:980 length:204 start_codon:yes stop_codon:yes gene_type:complete
MAKIQINGRKTTIKENTTIFDVLKRFKLNEKKVAVELNGVIIVKNKYKSKKIKKSDQIEIVQFIGGG